MKNTLGARAAEKIANNKVPEHLKNVTFTQCEMARQEVINFYAYAKQNYINYVENGVEYEEPVINAAYLGKGVYADSYPCEVVSDFEKWCDDNELEFYLRNISIDGVVHKSIRVHCNWKLLTKESALAMVVSECQYIHKRWPNSDSVYNACSARGFYEADFGDLIAGEKELSRYRYSDDVTLIIENCIYFTINPRIYVQFGGNDCQNVSEDSSKISYNKKENTKADSRSWWVGACIAIAVLSFANFIRVCYG